METHMLRYLVPCFLLLGFLGVSVSAMSLGVILNDRRNLDNYLTFYPISLLRCVKECILRRRCQSISYHHGYQYCQLAYTTRRRKDNTRFFTSDKNSWDNSIAGRCAEHGCNLNETCDMDTGACVIKDCGLLPEAVDPNAQVKHSGHHEVGSGVTYRCRGYMFNLTGMVPLNTYVIKCTDNGQWETANFFCRLWHSNLNGFCPLGYIYETGTCYMAHGEPKTRDAAEEYCATQNGHLLSVPEPTTTWQTTWGKFTFPGSVGQVLLDGRHYSGAWYNWAGQNLSYGALLDPAPQPGHDCVVFNVTDFTLEAVSCSQNFSFCCQFELCPTTAGYKLSKEDVCFKVRSERKFHDIECMENVTLKAMRDFYKSGVMDYNYYSGTTGFQRRYERQYLNLLSKYGKYAFNYDNVTSNYRGAYVYTCEPQGLVVGTLGTEELKWRFRHIIG